MTYKLADLKEQVKRVLDFSDEANYKVDKLLERWEEEKKALIELFNGQLVVECGEIPVLDLPNRDKQIRFKNFLDETHFSLDNVELATFLSDQGWDSFYANRVGEDWKKYGYAIPKGMRIGRAFKFFIKNKKELDKWQTYYSRIIQDVRISGKLCLSIHPLDYLSISENTYNWRSCHSLDGEYRAGNLSYMNDQVTIVAYVKSDHEHQLPNFPPDVPWNSKKWRMLLYVNKERNFVVSSKPYPYDNPTLVNKVYNELEKVLGGEWPAVFSDWGTNEEITWRLDDHDNSVHFNDCIAAMSYEPRYKERKDSKAESISQIIVGAPVYCLQCEQELIEFGADYNCIKCGDYAVCECCGCYMFNDEYTSLRNKQLCYNCYDDLVVWCDKCGTSLNRVGPESFFNSKTDTWYCADCYEKYITSYLHK